MTGERRTRHHHSGHARSASLTSRGDRQGRFQDGSSPHQGKTMRINNISLQTDCVTGRRLHPDSRHCHREEDSGGFPRFLHQEEGLLPSRQDDQTLQDDDATC